MVEVEWTGKRIACIIIFTILLGLPAIAFYIGLPIYFQSVITLDMILTAILGVLLGLLVGFILAFGGGMVFLAGFLGGLITTLIAVLGLMFGDTLGGFTGGLLINFQDILQVIPSIGPMIGLLVNLVLAPIMLSVPIDWILVERAMLPDSFYPWLILFGLLPWILAGCVAGLLRKGMPKGAMGGALVGINLMLVILILNGALVALASIFHITAFDIFSGLTTGMFNRSFFWYLMSMFEAAGISATFGALIGALRGPAEEK
ncbi:MAG: hypothetical protein EAX96_01365 [Candidatus Lokiarchaeota archaeon]|nr:hypothetical protein [Candidatus Lokiarchaeota archaeon]